MWGSHVLDWFYKVVALNSPNGAVVPLRTCSTKQPAAVERAYWASWDASTAADQLITVLSVYYEFIDVVGRHQWILFTCDLLHWCLHRFICNEYRLTSHCIVTAVVDGTLKLYSVCEDKQLHSCSPSSMVRFTSYPLCCFSSCCSCLPLYFCLLSRVMLCLNFSRYRPSLSCLKRRLLLLVAGTTICMSAGFIIDLSVKYSD